jgi:hypothetical protein
MHLIEGTRGSADDRRALPSVRSEAPITAIPPARGFAIALGSFASRHHKDSQGSPGSQHSSTDHTWRRARRYG